MRVADRRTRQCRGLLTMHDHVHSAAGTPTKYRHTLRRWTVPGLRDHVRRDIRRTGRQMAREAAAGTDFRYFYLKHLLESSYHSRSGCGVEQSGSSSGS